jgi:hypothetical protein
MALWLIVELKQSSSWAASKNCTTATAHCCSQHLVLAITRSQKWYITETDMAPFQQFFIGSNFDFE